MSRFGALLFGVMAAPALAAPPSVAVHAVQAAAGLVPPDAATIRFTAIQPMGRGATIYEARRGPAGVSRTIIDMTPGADGNWAVEGRDTKVMAAETLDYFTGRIDAAIGQGAANATCPADGPDYYAEHGTAGVAGACGDDPAAAIARALGLAEPVAP